MDVEQAPSVPDAPLDSNATGVPMALAPPNFTELPSEAADGIVACESRLNPLAVASEPFQGNAFSSQALPTPLVQHETINVVNPL